MPSSDAPDNTAAILFRLEKSGCAFYVCAGAAEGRGALAERLRRDARVIDDAAGSGARRRLPGAWTADVAVILVDAQSGVIADTRRHALLASLLGLSQVALAVNGMESIGFAEDVFARIAEESRRLGSELGLPRVACIPLSAARGDNVAERSEAMPWYRGPTLLGWLDGIAPDAALRRRTPPAEVANQFEATIVWSGEAPLLRGRGYRLEIGEQAATATISPIKYRLNPDSFERMPAPKLERGEIGVVNLELDKSVAFDAYRDNRVTGSFALVDPMSDETVGAGLLHFSLRRAQNVHWQAVDVNKAARSALKNHKPCVLWYTGLSGAGKSTIANLVDKKLHARGCHGYLLDGDNVRHGLNKDLGFTDADRVENIRRVAEVAKLMVDAGLVVSTAFISPFRAERRMARELFPEPEFLEIFVDTPLAVAEGRDPKGLYKKARRGELKNFTGIDSAYEAPESPELRLETTTMSSEQAADLVVEMLEKRGILDAD